MGILSRAITASGMAQKINLNMESFKYFVKAIPDWALLVLSLIFGHFDIWIGTLLCFVIVVIKLIDEDYFDGNDDDDDDDDDDGYYYEEEKPKNPYVYALNYI